MFNTAFYGFMELYSEFQLFVCPTCNFTVFVHAPRSYCIILSSSRQLFSVKQCKKNQTNKLYATCSLLNGSRTQLVTKRETSRDEN